MKQRRRRPEGTWSRFLSATLALILLVVGVPILLAVCSQAGLDSWHPIPSIGTGDEIRGYLDRGLTPTEIAPIALRSLLIVGWLMWAALMLSLIGSIAEARQGSRLGLPAFGLFGSMTRWIAAGLTALSAFVPQVASSSSNLSARLPFTMTSVTAAAEASVIHARVVEAPAPDGYARVKPGETVHSFAQRTLGDSSRWREIFELNQGEPVGPNGEAWSDVWRLRSGSTLKLPTFRGVAETVAAGSIDGATTHAALKASLAHILAARPSTAAGGDVVSQYSVQPGDSYWEIATRQLGPEASEAEVHDYTTALMNFNAPLLGHSNPAMLIAGDVISVLAPKPSAATSAAAPDVDPAPGTPRHVVVDNDSYWKIATDRAVVLYGPEGATNNVVYDLMVELIEINAARLGYDNPEMLHEGDIVLLEYPAAHPSSTPAPAPAPPVTAPASTMPPVVIEVTPPAAPLPAPQLVPQPAPAPLPAPTVPATPAPTAPPSTAAPSEAIVEAVVDAAFDPDEPVDEIEDTDSQSPIPASGLAGLSVIAAAGVGSLFLHRRRRASRCRPHQRPATLPQRLQADADAVMLRDVSEIDWLTIELRWLAHHNRSDARRTLTIQLARVGPQRELEVAFETATSVAPPDGWTAVSQRVWRLDRLHTADELEPHRDGPPIAPALVTLGASPQGRIYLNTECGNGINLVGDPAGQIPWIVNLVWEIAGGAIAEHPTVLLVDTPPVPGIDHLDNVMVADSDTARGFFSTPALDRTESMFDLRTGAWESWDSTVVILGANVASDVWAEIATRPDAAIIALDGSLPAAMEIRATSDELHVAQWNLTVEPPKLDDATVERITALLTAAEHPPIDDELIITAAPTEEPDPAPVLEHDDSANGHHDPVEPWELPRRRVMVELLGTPRVTINQYVVSLPPQQLAALAFIAVRREASLDEFCSAMWGDDQRVPVQRVRDLLSNLRKSAGGPAVVGLVRSDGIVRAGPDLGSDLDQFEACVERSNAEPAEWAQRMVDAVHLVSGRPFGYAAAAEQHWRWADLTQQHSLWENRVATVVYELGEHYLARNEPLHARSIANQGLQADPLNSALTEILMRSYAATGALDTARQVYIAHDKALTDRDLGGAAEETRVVLDRLFAAAQAGRVGDNSAAM